MFVANNPETLANLICAQALGIMQLARVGAGVCMTGAASPEIFPLDHAFIREACRNGVLASVGASRQRGGAPA